MKRSGLALAALAALGTTAASALPQAPPPPRVYTVYCGFTVMYACGVCVEVGTVTNCTYWAS